MPKVSSARANFTSPISPCCTSRRAHCNCGLRRWVKASTKSTPLAWAASIICRACATVTASGFSQRMCLPACARLDCPLAVHAIGQGVDDRVDFGIVQHSLVRAVGLGNAVLGCACFGPGLVPARYGRDLGIAYGLGRRQVTVEGDLGGAQYSIAHDVSHGVSCAVQSENDVLCAQRGDLGFRVPGLAQHSLGVFPG